MPLITMKSPPKAYRGYSMKCSNDQFASVSGNSTTALWKARNGVIGNGDLMRSRGGGIQGLGEGGEAGAADYAYCWGGDGGGIGG